MRSIIIRGTGAAILLLIICAISINSAYAKQTFSVAVLSDLADTRFDEINARYIAELESLVGDEFELTFKAYEIDWQSGDFDGQINTIYRKPDTDMLLVLGVAANQLLIQRKNFPKPTFLPFIIERNLMQAPFENGASGKRNLSYLSYSAQFSESIDLLQEVVQFSSIAILVDDVLLNTMPSRLPTDTNVTLRLISHGGELEDFSNRIPNDVDAVMFGYLPRLPEQQLVSLLDELTARNIPTFSYLEEGLIEKGLLATPLNDTLYQFAARRNALNMQAVMLGEPASIQPVLVETKSRFTINHSTAKKIGISVDFRVLLKSEVINFDVGGSDERYDLIDVSALAIKNNLQLKDQQFNRQIQNSELSRIKGGFRPQLTADANFLRRKDDSTLVQSGFVSEDSGDVSINLSQTLFSDAKRTNYKVQSILLEAGDAELKEVQLDVIREAALAMADVLQAESVAAIQQENASFSERNLELATDRVNIGASSLADQYRWETQAANGKSAVFEAFSRVIIAKQNLNRILNFPITQPIELAPLDLDKLMVFSVKESFELMNNTATFETVYNAGLQGAYEQSPEIKRLQAQIAAKRRELKAASRQGWLPQLTLTGQLSETFGQESDLLFSQDERDWQVMLNARLPFFQGGQIKSEVKTAQTELAQLESRVARTKLRLAQSLRTSMNNSLISLFNLDFSKSAASAASRSLSLVTDSYAKGVVPIVDLLNAQNVSISANLAEVQASIGFFRALIEMQRTLGEYDFLMSEARKKQRVDAFRSVINTPNSGSQNEN